MGRADAGENVRKLTELSRRGPPADIVIWPETAYPYVALFRGADLGEVPAARAVGAALILGALSADADDLQDGQRRVFNSMVVAGPDGNVRNIYHKSHLVPFGEYSPWGGLLPAPGTLTPGRGPEIIDLTFDGGTQERVRAMQFVFAPAICYEVIFTDSLLPETSGGGQPPRAIVNITNDTWFGSTPGPHQHLDMARRYAIESGLPVARANYSGISAFISADGRVAGSLGIGVSGVLDGRLSGAHETAYRRIGRDGIMFIILALTAAVCIPGRRRKG
jgi:apolipoprotein N-acyltransferase